MRVSSPQDEQEQPATKPGWFKRTGTVLLVLSPLALGYATKVSVCPSAFFLHQPCPGCGLTRASVALAQADFATAIAFNPVAPFVCPLLVGTLAWAFYTYIRFGRMRVPRWVGWPVALAAVALNVVWVARLFGAFGGMVPI